ncbi:MAG: AraC family transcriptional regulator [Alphaproteobacteria bacterium]|nr:AraC family transcriptional regulator [Alphaproteobacteria bacterium]
MQSTSRKGGTPEEARIWQVNTPEPMEVIRARFTTHRFAPHFHETFVIGVTESGVEEFEAGGGTYRSTPGSVRPYNPGEVHTGSAAEGGHWAYRAYYPSRSFMREIASQMAGHDVPEPRFGEFVVDDPGLAAELLDLHRALCEPVSALERDSSLLQAFGKLIERHSEDRPQPARLGQEHMAVRRARELIADRLNENVSLDELSAVAGLSPYHLIRVFKRAVGLTPFAYQTQSRIDQARDMLRRGLAPANVARRCGFYDQSHFSRTFKGRVGVSPGQYARAIRKD